MRVGAVMVRHSIIVLSSAPPQVSPGNKVGELFDFWITLLERSLGVDRGASG